MATSKIRPSAVELERQARLEALFLKIKSGESDQFVEFVELERAELYDYCLRMTGKREPALRVLDEVLIALRGSADQYASVADLRLALFATLRSFSAHLWNGRNEVAEHQGIKDLEAVGFGGELSKENILLLEIFLSDMPGWEREPLLLKLRFGYSDEDVARLMGLSVPTVRTEVEKSLQKICQHFSWEVDVVEKALVLLPRFRVGGADAKSTAAISEIVGGMETVRRANARRLMMKIVIFAGFFLGIFILLFLLSKS